METARGQRTGLERRGIPMVRPYNLSNIQMVTSVPSTAPP